MRRVGIDVSMLYDSDAIVGVRTPNILVVLSRGECRERLGLYQIVTCEVQTSSFA